MRRFAPSMRVNSLPAAAAIRARSLSSRSASVGLSRVADEGPGRGFSILGSLSPDFPGRAAAGVDVFEQLALLEGVHAGPEAVVGIGDELPFGGQALERLLDEILAGADVIEDVLVEDEVPPVDAHPHVLDVADALHAAPVFRLHEVEAARRGDADEAGGGGPGSTEVDRVRDGHVAQPVAVVG